MLCCKVNTDTVCEEKYCSKGVPLFVLQSEKRQKIRCVGVCYAFQVKQSLNDNNNDNDNDNNNADKETAKGWQTKKKKKQYIFH